MVAISSGYSGTVGAGSFLTSVGVSSAGDGGFLSVISD